jgi:nickel/cobalt exporter
MSAGRRFLGAAAFAAIAMGAIAAAHAASPFGIATPDSGGGGFGGPLAPFFTWIARHQAAFYRDLTAALSDSKSSGAAVWLLLGLSFAYGVFHAAGPGHGKAVITSYLVSSGESARRGVVISFAAAFVQAIVAILIVTIASLVFRATAMTMTAATNWIEVASYALIAIVGGWLLWAKTFGGGHHHHHHHPHHHHVPAPEVAGDTAPRDHHDHDRHDHDHHHPGHLHGAGGHDHDHTHDHNAHAHGSPPPSAGWAARPWAAITAVGIRPCSGAIIVLVFALSQGLLAVGIAATLIMAVGTGLTVATLAVIAVTAKGLALRLAGVEEGSAGLFIRAIEIAGAAVVFLFGLTLLGGALATGTLS